MARSFCTDLAIERGEPLAGTGALAQRHLFIRWPKGKWRRPRFESADMDEALQAAMRDASGNGRYVGLVEGGDGPDLQLFSFPDMTTLTPPSQEAAAEAIRDWGDGDGFGGGRLPRPIILCCTDAKTDACCARYGFPLYKALAKVADGYGFDVLQCTHIGGCHFAPSVIVMPNRDRYGRLTPAEVQQFLQALAEGRYYLPAFKGRDGLDEAGQAADIAAMNWAEANGFSQADVRLLDDALPDGARHAITAAVGTARLHIVLERAVFEVHGTCRLLEDGPGKPVPRWSVVAIAPALADHAVTAAR